MNRSISSLLMFVSLVTLAASSVAQSPRAAPPPVFTAKQTAALESLVANVKSASRTSLEKDDWSIMARLYPPDTFSCWTSRYSKKPHAFLSMPAIPDNARHEVRPLGKYHFGNRDPSKMGATHFIEFSYTVPYLAKCGDSSKRINPRPHFYLRQSGDAFELAYPCPPIESNLPPGFSSDWQAFSVVRAHKAAEAMAPAERSGLRKKLLGETYNINTILNLQDRYQVSEEESYVMIDRICELTSGD